MQADVVVLGAGMIGVSTALQLQRRGRNVVLVDRRAPGEETSYGNAGLIQREAVEPYPFPHDSRMIFKVARKGGIDVNYHPSALPHLASPLAQYWWWSSPSRYAQVAREYSRLIAHCLSEHDSLIEEAGAGALVRKSGWRTAYRSQEALEKGLANAERLAQEYGVEHAPVSGDELARLEPGLTQRLAGAVHWTQPWSVRDPGALVASYASLFQARGGAFVSGDAATLERHGAGWRVTTSEGPVEAAEAVVALGPWSDELLRRFDYHLPLFVKRGYHRHYDMPTPLSMAMLDAENGIMLAPMNRGLRITTGAEFARLDARATPLQSSKAERVARELLAIGDAVEQTPWLGARPCTPDMKPVIGPAPKHAGLWFHFGHAHQGFTLGPASGRLLAEMMCGETPYIEPAPYSAKRF
ncbi:FAD-binding oxidoreductase [Salinicola sp. DM10]|uniref:NAD(P)/FAD-dependent oxidoreductase n=1 Tax=Salinicola sp. DM10 TaxID=2815721 RepID=UPI001A8E5226|nr:FAD-dependent oxidoreductase [Salinicola sp. DM10]MCE3027064.1 FAD-binding oxidoreductase [Salinicola sp. DM10]